MLLFDPFTLALQIIISVICQPKPHITDSRSSAISSKGWYPVVPCGITLYANIKYDKCSGQLLFCSFDKDLSRSIIVWLNLSQVTLPHGLYGMLVDCSTLIHGIQVFNYFILKTLALVAMNFCGNTIHIKPFVHQYFCYSTFWFGVINARLNLVKASVRTKMFSLPSFEGSTLVKSIHSRSIGSCAMTVSSFVFGST